eukprot:jgi/Undpi1/8532/HiC_scaffold_25.g10999.m1
MSGLEIQQWYIEEIPATDPNDPQEEVVSASVAADHDHPSAASVETALEDAGEPLVVLDTGSTALDADQSKEVNGSNGSTNSTSKTAHAPLGDLAVQGREMPWACKTIPASSSAQAPCPRGGCSWTKVGSKYILFGGADAHQQHFDDVHCFDAATGKWEETSVSGTPPSSRSGHSAVALGASLVVYGGMNVQDGVTFNDIYELRTGSMEWVSLPCADTPPRNSHAAVLDGDTMVLIGGASPDGQTDEVFTIDLSDRSNLSCVRVDCQPSVSGACVAQSDGVGGAPAARDMHSACVCNSELTGGAGAIILVMGGRSSTGVLQDFFSLNTDTWTWSRLKDAPVARCAHSACLMQDAGIMAIFGGWDGGTLVADDLHLYDVRCGKWTTPNILPRPMGRFAHAACTGGGDNVVVFGGVNPEEDLTDVVVITAP